MSAEIVRTFFRHLTHTKGKWAGKQFELLPWQEEVVEKVFGTLKADGTRRYRICYLEIPKKNGKSEFAAAIALYMLCADKEEFPEVYIAACDREQASLIYGIAAAMVRANSVLAARLKILDSRKRIVYPKHNGIMQVLSSEVHTKHGLNPSCVIFDELHAQPNDELWRVLTVGTDYARSQQLILVCTTAGLYNQQSIWWRIREKARQIEEGIIEDPSFLPILYSADPEKDDPHDEELWKRVNPSLGRIFTLDKIREDYNAAKNDPIEWEDFKRYRLNIPSRIARKWMPMDAWDACGKPYDITKLDGRACYGGLDLSTTIDLSAFVLVFPPDKDDGDWYVIARCYCPEDTVRARVGLEITSYTRWIQQGVLIQTPGNVIDYEYIKRDILAANKRYNIIEIGYDPWNCTQIATELYNTYGIKMIEVRQGARSLSEPSKDILRTVLAKKLRHGGNPILRWCADNIVMVADANENIRPAKDKSGGRIDALVAMIIAWSRAMQSVQHKESIYNERGLIVL